MNTHMNTHVIAPANAWKDGFLVGLRQFANQIFHVVDSVRVANVVANDMQRIAQSELTADAFESACNRARQ